MSKDKYSQLVVISNEDVASTSFIYLHGNNIEDSEKIHGYKHIIRSNNIYN